MYDRGLHLAYSWLIWLKYWIARIYSKTYFQKINETFGAIDRRRACAAQKLASVSQQHHYVLGGCNHARLMHHLVYINRISIPLSHPLTIGRSFPQRDAWFCNLRFKPCKVSGTTNKPDYLSHICRIQPCMAWSLEEPRPSQRLEGEIYSNLY